MNGASKGECTDKIKGKARQVAGDLTNDEVLHAEGETDESVREAKGLVDNLAESFHDAIDWSKTS